MIARRCKIHKKKGSAIADPFMVRREARMSMDQIKLLSRVGTILWKKPELSYPDVQWTVWEAFYPLRNFGVDLMKG